ncbi:hypothetical protein [Bradyrhizobium icense]|uniref:Phage portal protein n=1 Tax=Bradyrhizobium icense TaxID=1274631 RepID=A0A1B1UD51_9BRAD|nr:hypothetical protein [Bradyrhizobium icense]ANW00678.1 hypothetical protein LMTR13_11365 [Bradyrhizobium icense]
MASSAVAYRNDTADELPRESLLDVADLVRMFEESEESTYEARQLSERDRDYVDNKQLTEEELATLKKRGQPPQIDNRIKTKIDYLVGLEKQQRIDPKALPRTPIHEVDADGATQALRYVAETENFDAKRSGVWRNMLVEGAGGIGVSVSEAIGYNGQPGIEVKLRRYAWDRIFWDPHSSETDFSDAGYLGVVVWMDYDDAVAMYGDEQGAVEALDTTLSTAPSQTYDDKPKFTLWADKKRKRVRICQIWIKKAEQWHFAEYTKGGILKAGPSPYMTDKGESDCELFFQSAYVDRDNNRYGLVREMITLQDGINKRHSKALHLLNSKTVRAKKGAVDDVEKARREIHRPEGWLEVNDLGLPVNETLQIDSNTDLAAAQLGLLQEAKNAIDLKGPNATQMGDKTQGSSAASGKAILASQQGGMISLGDLLDNLRHLDRRVFRAVWARIRQFWTTEKWIRVTDDERNIKWVGMNLDPEKMQQLQAQAQQNPQVAAKIGGIIASIAELDCDIIIDEVPDVIASQEQFAMLVDLKKMDANNELPFRALVQASSIKDKSKMLDEMDKAKQPNPQVEQLKLRGAVAEVAETESKAALNMAKAREAGMPDQAAPMQPPEQEIPMEVQIQQAIAEIMERHASAKQKNAAAHKTMVEADLAPAKAEHDASLAEANFAQGIKDRDADRKIAAKQKVGA